MNIQRNVMLTFSTRDIIAALKLAHKGNLAVQAIPSSGATKDMGIDASQFGITFTVTKADSATPAE